MSTSAQKDNQTNPPNMFQFLSDGVKKYEEKQQHLKLNEKARSPYSLYEDLKIIFAFSKKVENKTPIFQELASGALSHRSEESIRSRYKDYIKELNSVDLSNITRYVVNKKSIEGYLFKEKDENGNDKFIVRETPKHPSNEAKVQRPKVNRSSFKEVLNKKEEQKRPLKRRSESTPEILINGKKLLKQDQPKKQNEMVDEKEEEEKEFEFQKKPVQKQQEENEEDMQKSKKKKDNVMEIENQKVQGKQVQFNPPQQQQQGGQKHSTQLTEQEFKDARELDVYVHFIANYDNVQKKSLIHTLDKLSGDFNQLVDYLQTQNHNLLWKEDEDQVLHNFSSQSPQAIYLLKTLKKGKENILRRAAYLGIELPDFE